MLVPYISQSWEGKAGGGVKGTINLAVKCEILAPKHGANISAGISSETCCEESPATESCLQLHHIR